MSTTTKYPSPSYTEEERIIFETADSIIKRTMQMDVSADIHRDLFVHAQALYVLGSGMRYRRLLDEQNRPKNRIKRFLRKK